MEEIEYTHEAYSLPFMATPEAVAHDPSLKEWLIECLDCGMWYEPNNDGCPNYE